MVSYPLVKTRWSNEHLMAAVLIVLTLYHLPQWVENPLEIISFLLLTIFGLLLDAIVSVLRYKRLWCCVSGGVTGAMVSLLTEGIPLWGRLLGVALALILGKHLMGGTGKNLLNPAIIGTMLILPYFGVPETFFLPSILLLPAILLGLVFLRIRPYAGVAFMLGLIVAMALRRELTFDNVLAYGVLFWGCLVLTDPVTVTPHPVVGGVLGFLAGALPLIITDSPIMIVYGVLAVNLISRDLSRLFERTNTSPKPRLNIAKVYTMEDPDLINLTEEPEVSGADEIKSYEWLVTTLTREQILERIYASEIYGMGGAAFSTGKKVEAVMEASASKKHLIINGVECDPGLIHDKWLMKQHEHELILGVELLKKCIDFTTVTLAVKQREGRSEEVYKVHEVKDLYPVGAEPILIKEVLGVELARERLPAQEGILVLNVQTVYAVSQAVLQKTTWNIRYITVASLRERTAKVVKVKLGMKLKDIMEAVYPGVVTIFAGGGLMQARLAEEEAVVDPKVNFIGTGRLPNYKESPQCSGCDNCRRYCPVHLPVKRITDYVDQKKPEEARKLGVQNCISCGSCSYTCLAGNNLAAKVKSAKEAIARE